jgi:hypothetical protein
MVVLLLNSYASIFEEGGRLSHRRVNAGRQKPNRIRGRVWCAGLELTTAIATAVAEALQARLVPDFIPGGSHHAHNLTAKWAGFAAAAFCEREKNAASTLQITEFFPTT